MFYVRKGWLPLVDKFFVALERDLPVLFIQELLLIKNKILSVSSPATDSREEWAFQRFGFFWSPVNSLKQDTGHFLSPVSYSGCWCSFSSPWWVLLSLSLFLGVHSRNSSPLALFFINAMSPNLICLTSCLSWCSK